jgi:hypothetical protein
MTLGQIILPRCGIFSSRLQPSSPWTETASSSKCMESSLASTRRLRWWGAAAARVDLHSMARWQQQQWQALKQIYSAGSYCGNEKP